MASKFDVDAVLGKLPGALATGLIGAILLTLSSPAAGARRNRGGILELLGLEALSFGHGAAIMNVTFLVGMVLMVIAWAKLGREIFSSGVDRNPEITLSHVRKAMYAWIAPLLLAAPMLSRDVYSYLMQGAMVRDGFDPYTEGAAVNPGPFLLEVSHDWRNTTTPYGPLHLWIGQAITSLVGDNVAAGIICYKIVSVLGFLAIAWAIPHIATQIGGNPGVALWLGVANPVMIFHMIGGMHNESVMVGLVSIGLLLCLRRRFLAGTAVIAVAVALKATAAIALPFVVWMAAYYFWRQTQSKLRQLAIFIGVGISGVVITVAVVAIITWASGASWGWLSEITGNSKVINPLAAPTVLSDLITPAIQLFIPDFDYNVVLSFVRPVFSVGMLIGLVITWWIFRGGNRRSIMGTAAAYQVAFMLSTVVLPWYYASSLSLAGTFQTPKWVMKLITAAVIIIALAFSGSGNHQLYNPVWMILVTAAAWILTTYIFPITTTRKTSHV